MKPETTADATRSLSDDAKCRKSTEDAYDTIARWQQCQFAQRQRQRHTIHLAVQHNSHGIHKVPIHSHGASEAIHSTCIASSSMSHQECSQQCRSHQQLTCSNACPQVWRSFCLVPMAPWSRLSSDVRIRLSARCHHRCCRRNRCHQRRSCFCTSERQPEPQQPIPA